MTRYHTYLDDSTQAGQATILGVQQNGSEYGVGITSSVEVENLNVLNSVGIGTTNPTSKLHISGSPGTLLRIDGGIGGTGTRDIVITEFNTTAYGGIIRYDSVADLFTVGTIVNSTVVNAINITRDAGNVGIGITNPTSALSVSGNANITGTATAETLVASKVASTNPLAYTNSTFGNGWSVIAPVSTTYYKLATLPASTTATFDDMVIEGVIGGFGSAYKQPFKIYFGNRDGFNYEYDSYGTVQSFAKIIAISTNNTVEIWAQHGANNYTTLTYSISSSIQVNVVSNPTPTTTAPVGTTVFDSSSATYKPRFSIDNSGRVTMPFQPSFYAYNTTGNNITNGNIIDFGTTLSNVGSHYSTSTSRFTAPVAGSYYFYAQLLSEDSTVTTDFRFYVNGNVKNGGYSGSGTWTNGNGYKTATGATVLLLAANDIVDVRSVNTSSIHQDAAHTYWLGYLLG